MQLLRNLPVAALLLGGAAVLLSGCSATSTDDTPSSVASSASASATAGASASTSGSTATTAPTATTEPSTTATTSAAAAGGSGTCGSDTATVAVRQAAAALTRPIPAVPSARWDPTHADTSAYDPCAALSWAVLSVTDGTPSSPNAILLFHDGAFLGTATSTQYPFEPTVTRSSAASIAVTYRYVRAGDANADPSGTTHATFTWDARTRTVRMGGTVPPDVR